MATSTMVCTNTKTRPCHFWMDGDRCKFTAAQCRFAHSMGAVVAHQPKIRVQGKADPPKANLKEPKEVEVKEINYAKEVPKEADLISLCSFVEEIPKAEAAKVEEPKVEVPNVETPKMETPNTHVQKPQGHMSNGVPGRGRSPKRTPKTTPKNSPKHSPKQTPKQASQTRNKSESLQHVPKQSPTPSIASVDGSIARDLRTAIVQGKDLDYIKNSLTSKPVSAVKESLSLSRQGVSAIFSAVAEGRNDVLRLMILHGADPNARHLPSGIPVLASAIFQNNAAAITTVAVLLDLGADPFVIPKGLWDDNESFSSVKDDPLKTQWCDEANKALLSKCFNMSVKHYLQEAARKITEGGDVAFGPSVVNRESDNHLLVGQEVALRRVNEHLRCHMLCGRNEPLVLAFVGPAGHGKTELARRIGTIQPLSSAFSTSTVMDEGSERANPADHVNVICLDDMNGADPQQLTYILDGNDKATNHKNTIIILSTTLDITKFPLDYYRHLSPDVNDHIMWLAYEAQAQKHLVNIYGHSIASRISSIIPFVPYTPKQTALIAHKSILDAAAELTKSVSSTVDVNVDVDPPVCAFLGEAFYDLNSGARSIQLAVLQKVKMRMVEEYFRFRAHPAATGEKLELTFVVRLGGDKSVSVGLE